MTIQHASIPDAQLHEPKGVASANAQEVYSADGAGSGSWAQPVHIGFWDYNDSATASTPIPLTVATTEYEVTNDGLGPFSSKTWGLNGVTDIWDVSTNRFDFSNLSLGDTVDIRFDVEFDTTTTNTEVSLLIELGVGGSPYQLPILSEANQKTIGIHKHVIFMGVYMGDANTRDNPARVLASAEKTGVTIKVNGWYVRAITRSQG